MSGKWFESLRPRGKAIDSAGLFCSDSFFSDSVCVGIYFFNSKEPFLLSPSFKSIESTCTKSISIFLAKSG